MINDENTNRLKMVLQNGIDCHKGQKLIMLTLTLKKGSQNDLQRCFEKFVERVQQLNPKFQLDYFSVNVEGQYMHIYYYGPFLLQKWIARIWKEITGDSYIVDIRTVSENPNIIAQFIVSRCNRKRKIIFQTSHEWSSDNKITLTYKSYQHAYTKSHTRNYQKAIQSPRPWTKNILRYTYHRWKSQNRR